MLQGRCLCGQIALTMPRRPDLIYMCNCRLCRASGAAWAYFTAREVTVTGATKTYRREDMADCWLDLHFCPHCGATTHYTATEHHPSDRVGINTRLFAQDLFTGAPVTYQDGRAVVDENDDFVTTATGHIGDGRAF